MRRFITAVVTNTATPIVVIASAMPLASHTSADVSFNRSGTAFVEHRARNLAKTRASNARAISVGNFRADTTPRLSAHNVRELKARVADLEANLATKETGLYAVLREIRELEERIDRLRDAVARLLSKEEYARVEARFQQAQQANVVDTNLAVVAQALQIVDEDFQRRFNTKYSLLDDIWLTPGTECNEEAANALKGFFEANEQRLPKALRMKFFSAWQSVRERCNRRFTIPKDEVRKLKPDELKAALEVCCGTFRKDVRATLFEVIQCAIERGAGTSPPLAPQTEYVAKLEAKLVARETEYNAEVLKRAELVEILGALRWEVARLRSPGKMLATESAEFRFLALPIWWQPNSFDIVAQALQIVDEDFQRRFGTEYSLLCIRWTPIDRRDEEAANALKGFFEANEQRLPKTLRKNFFSVWHSVRERYNRRPSIPKDEVRKLKPDELKAALEVCCETFRKDARAPLFEVIQCAMEQGAGTSPPLGTAIRQHQA